MNLRELIREEIKKGLSEYGSKRKRANRPWEWQTDLFYRMTKPDFVDNFYMYAEDENEEEEGYNEETSKEEED